MKEKLIKAISNEFGRLAHSNKHGVSFTDTIDFFARQDLPPDKKVTYMLFLFDYLPLKEEKYRCRIIVGRDKLTTN